jgi:alpha-tubulin suppressor-like RCC1 family protein
VGDGTTTNRSVPTQVGTAADWRLITVGASSEFTCAIKQNNALWCWGENSFGKLGDGTASNRSSPVQVGSATDWVAVAPGHDHTCALKTGGSLYCWGDNNYAQLANGAWGPYTGSYTPIQAGADTDWAALAGGYHHACALKTGGALYCWGRNNTGQLGIGSTLHDFDGVPSPTRVGSEADWSRVAAGGQLYLVGHTCAIKSDQSLFCWGENYFGQIGMGAFANKHVPTQAGAENDWYSASAGGSHTCVQKVGGALWCWGSDRLGQLGLGRGGDQSTPFQIGTSSTWTAVSSGDGHSCAIQSGSSLFCWGWNVEGQLGNGTKGLYANDYFTPTPVVPQDGWQMVSAGANLTCAIMHDATLWCWGQNDYGQLGNGNTFDSASPIQVAEGTSWEMVATGVRNACGIRSDSTLWCWGSGPLGDGTSDAHHSPIQIGVGSSWAGIARGRAHACGIKTDQSLWCWGYNYNGELGDGTTTSRNTPTRVGNANDWASVTVGEKHSCAIKTSGTLHCWGYNEYGNLGLGTSGQYYEATATPHQVGTAADWQSVEAGGHHTCAMRTNGSLWCWGWNENGQLGDGTAFHTAPVSL